MKKLLLILIALPMIGFGQDYIILKTGEEVAVEIIEHNDNSISYFKYKSEDKIKYIQPIENIYMIKYMKSGETIIPNITDKVYYEKKWGEKYFVLVLITIVFTIIVIAST